MSDNENKELSSNGITKNVHEKDIQSKDSQINHSQINPRKSRQDYLREFLKCEKSCGMQRSTTTKESINRNFGTFLNNGKR